MLSEVSLAYIKYPYSVTIGAMRAFKEKTGKDLTNTLWAYSLAYRQHAGNDEYERLKALTDVCDFFDASQLFHALFKTENSCISLEEIQDGMFRVSGTPESDVNENCYPWPYLIVKIASEVDEFYSQNLKDFKKKLDTSEQ